jgi:hypothetical protein
MPEEKKLFTPKEAAKYLSDKAGREINVNRLAQLRRAGKVKATRIGYNATVYTLEDLINADVSLSKAGRKPDKMNEDTDKHPALNIVPPVLSLRQKGNS